MTRIFLMITALLMLPFAAAAERIAITGATLHTMGEAGVIENATILIDGDKIQSVTAEGAVPDGYRAFDAAGRPVTPGFMSAITSIGLNEVGSSADLDDGIVSDAPFSAAFDVSRVIDSTSTHIPITRVEGLTRVGVAPKRTGHVFLGQGATMHLGNGDPVTSVRAFQMADLGSSGGARAGGSRAAAWALFLNALREAEGGTPGGMGEPLTSYLDMQALRPVAGGDTLLIIRADRAADIQQVVRLSAEQPELKLAIYGGAEGWMVADDLAAAGIPVILTTHQNLPGSFDTRASTRENPARLNAAGVTIAFSDGTSQNARLIVQLAGTAVAHGLPHEAGLAALTTNPASILGLSGSYGRVEPGMDADVVVWDGDPLEVMSAPTNVIIRGDEVPLVSRQTKLRDRYLDLSDDSPFIRR